MLETYSQNLTVTANTTIPFNVNSLKKNCTVTHTEGSTSISLNKAGVYAVYFNAVGTLTDAGTFSAQMLKDGNTVAQAVSGATAGAGETANISFSTLVFVNPSCSCVNNKATLTFSYTGGAGTIANANVIVLKVS